MHTPGPWQLRDASDEVGPFFIIDSGNGPPDLAHPRGLHISGIINGPDARLIAAAPDMLDALKDAAASLKDDDEEVGIDPNDDPVLQKILAVIAKASEQTTG